MAMEQMKKIQENMQNKYRNMNEIYVLTKEMEIAIKSNDDVSLKMVLDMRGNHMARIDKIDEENRQIISKMPKDQQEKFNNLVFPTGTKVRLENPLETSIFDTTKQISNLLKKILELDKSLNQKLQR